MKAQKIVKVCVVLCFLPVGLIIWLGLGIVKVYKFIDSMIVINWPENEKENNVSGL
jgi:hypothetical protein